MAQVKLNQVRKAFGKVEVIKGVDLDLHDGEFIVFVGPSGCGKSTLLRLIAGLEDITSGDLFIDGVRVNDLPPSRRGISMVFQSYALFPHMTVKENMSFGLRLAKAPADEIEKKVGDAARILQLEPLLERKPQGSVRRPAPAGGHRALHRAQPEGVFVRRAVVQPGRCASRADAYRDRQVAQ